jgi:hypothetical protein
MKGEYQRIGDPRWEWWKQMKKRDPKFEWKMPINFYGKVLDQANQPVHGASVRFQWTDMSAAGTTEKFTTTDAQGMFSLTGEKGKNLGVYVSKSGYHAVVMDEVTSNMQPFLIRIISNPIQIVRSSSN